MICHGFSDTKIHHVAGSVIARHQRSHRQTFLLSQFASDHAADDEAISKREAVLQRNKGSPERLVKWAAEPPDDETSEAPVTIGPSTIGAGNGLFVTRSLKRNEHIMTIPHDKIISVENAWEDESLGPEFRYLTDVGGPGAKLATLAGFVAKEACGQIDGIFELNDDSDRTSSYWQEYLDCLPWRDDHPLWWSDEETNRLLKGSVIEEEVRSTRIQVSNAIENVKALFWNHWISDKAEADDSYMEAGETEAAEIAVRSAFCMLLSRAFEDQETDCMKLVPLLDMTQHSDEGDENISHSTHPTTGNIRVTAKRDLDAGEELFTCYSTTLSPAQFLPAFAFVPNQMGVSGRQLLGHKDPIFFPVEKGNR